MPIYNEWFYTANSVAPWAPTVDPLLPPGVTVAERLTALGFTAGATGTNYVIWSLASGAGPYNFALEVQGPNPDNLVVWCANAADLLSWLSAHASIPNMRPAALMVEPHTPPAEEAPHADG